MTKKWPGARPEAPDDGHTEDALKADFDAAHRAGQQALKDRDFEAVARAIERERGIIKQLRGRIDRLTNKVNPAPPRRRR